jgi:DHA1 family bicyclomycin/chloramphenicol resistance-like MFS transporter
MKSQNHYFFLLVVIMIGSVSLLATDIYLPALPEMATYFNCNQTQIQSSFTVFLLGLAGCQLATGMLTDKFGQKRVALVGFSLFTLASLGCAYATTLPEFIGFRFMQAIGGGVGSVIGRAVVVDRFKRHEAVKIFSTTLPIIGLSSAVAPLIGGYLTYYLGWRSTFFFMVVFGITLVIFAFLFLSNKKVMADKTLAAVDLNMDVALDLNSDLINKQNKKHARHKVQQYFGTLRNLEFLGYALIVCAGFCIFRSYTVESPFVFHKQGFEPEEMGHFYIALSVAYFSGNMVAKKLVNKQSLENVLRIGLGFSLLGGICMVTSALLYTQNPYGVIVPMSIITFGNGFLFPISTAGAMTSVPAQFSGTASGLMGCIQFVMAAVCINCVGRICQGELLPLSIFIGTIIFLGLCSYLILIATRSKATVTVN